MEAGRTIPSFWEHDVRHDARSKTKSVVVVNRDLIIVVNCSVFVILSAAKNLMRTLLGIIQQSAYICHITSLVAVAPRGYNAS